MANEHETQIVWMDIAAIHAYEGNARKHGKKQIDLLKKSMTEYGWTSPVLMDGDGVCVAGHGRLEAALQLGMTRAPVIRLAHLTHEQAKAYRIADNRLAELAMWDEHILADELEALSAMDIDIELTGFSEEEVERQLGGMDADDGDDDEDVDEPENAIVKFGDVWILGDHRLVCGDSTDAGAWRAALDGSQPDLLMTSPPYDDQRTYTTGVDKHDWTKLMTGVFSNLPPEGHTQVMVNLGLIRRGGENIEYWRDWMDGMRADGWKWCGHYVWDKQDGAPGDWDGCYAPAHEWVFHLRANPAVLIKTVPTVVKPTESARQRSHTFRQKDGSLKRESSPEKLYQLWKIPDSVIRLLRNNGNPDGGDHPATFPTALPQQIIEAMAPVDGLVIDPFLGSGQTIAAAENCGRRSAGIEIEPKYCDIAIARWEKLTGEKAVREHAGNG